jgi:hypothetical protein
MAAAPEIGARRTFGLAGDQDITLAICVLGILVVLLIPLPTLLLDLLLTINISLSVVILLGTLYLQRPVEFAVFPSLLADADPLPAQSERRRDPTDPLGGPTRATSSRPSAISSPRAISSSVSSSSSSWW